MALALLVLAPLAPIRAATAQEQVEGNRYANARYGIEITKPSGWYFITAGMVLDLAQKAAGATRPRLDPDPVKAAGFAVIVSKAPALGRGFEPQVILLVREEERAPADLVAACERLRGGMTEPETVRATQKIQVDGKPAARLDFLGYVDGAAVRATALCTFRDRRAYVVVGQALVTDFDADAVTFDAILQSFHAR